MWGGAGRLLAEGLTGLSSIDGLRWKTSRQPKPKPPPPPSLAFYLRLSGAVAIVAGGVGVYLYLRLKRVVKQMAIRRQSLQPNSPVGNQDTLTTIDGGAGCKYRILMHPNAAGAAPASSAGATWFTLQSGTRSRTLCHPSSVTLYFIIRGYGSLVRDTDASNVRAGDSVTVRPGSRHHLIARSQDLVFLSIADLAVSHEDYPQNFARHFTQASDTLLTAMSQYVASGSDSTQRLVEGATRMREDYSDTISRYIGVTASGPPSADGLPRR